MAKFRDKSAQEGERYKHEKTDIQDEARKLENEVAMERKRADRYDLAEVFLEIGLVIHRSPYSRENESFGIWGSC